MNGDIFPILIFEGIEKLANTNLLMIGAKAIGCELLKNYAMLGLDCGKKDAKSSIKGGSIVLTDPDVVEGEAGCLWLSVKKKIKERSYGQNVSKEWIKRRLMLRIKAS